MPADWTIDEACEFLDPPITAKTLQTIVTALGIEPAGKRRPVGKTMGRPFPTYPMVELMLLHTRLSPWLSPSGRIMVARLVEEGERR